jgi:hypothetical protein
MSITVSNQQNPDCRNFIDNFNLSSILTPWNNRSFYQLFAKRAMSKIAENIMISMK